MGIWQEKQGAIQQRAQQQRKVQQKKEGAQQQVVGQRAIWQGAQRQKQRAIWQEKQGAIQQRAQQQRKVQQKKAESDLARSGAGRVRSDPTKSAATKKNPIKGRRSAATSGGAESDL